MNDVRDGLRTLAVALFVLIGTTTVVVDTQSQPLRLILPTSNAALFDDDGPTFYMYTDRFFEGQRSRPWQGGQYGFVRNPERTDDGLIFTRFHEGIDIAPIYRDRQGEPLDTVRAIDDGTVVYVNNGANASTYGRYVVVEHWWDGSPFYSLYAHLNRTEVRAGQRVRQGDALGRLGYTGRGINRRRAHLHFEINVKLSSDFNGWFRRQNPRGNNIHGVYNGINLAGLDVDALYRALAKDSTLTIDRFIAEKQSFYSVVIPNRGMPDFLERYPWKLENAGGPASDEVPGWEIHFTASGFPVRVVPIFRSVSEPFVSSVRNTPHRYERLTIGRIEGEGNFVTLSRRGLNYLSLIAPVRGQLVYQGELEDS
jgi:murein DD-endopeptidase MepM/ murein hydrolase activator NlpD